MRKIILTSVMALSLVFAGININEQKDSSEEEIVDASATNMKFEIISDTAAELEKGSGEGDVKIPSKVRIDGKVYAVESIGNGAFYGRSGLTSVTIPSSVTSIGVGAFEDCSGLTSVTIPSSVTIIGNSAFRSCSGPTSITIPSGVTSIGEIAFLDCSSLTNINVSSSNPYYTSVNGVLYDKEMKMIIACPGGVKGKIVIPSGVTIIEKGAFVNCVGLTSITIPSCVTSIGEQAFKGCENLDVVIDNSEEKVSVGDSAFDGCKSVTWKK
jgi:hypothetical protein